MTRKTNRYSENVIKIVRNAAGMGLATTKELAQIVGVSQRTFQRWVAKYPNLAVAIEEGKRIATGEHVEAAFIKQALPHDEVTERFEMQETESDDEEEESLVREMVLVARQVKRDVVNVTAAEKILRAYKPQLYKENVEIGTDDELGQLLKEISGCNRGLDID